MKPGYGFRDLFWGMRERRLTSILVLHDSPMAACLANRIALLQNGSLVALGSNAEVLACHAMRNVFQVEFVTERKEDDRVEIHGMQLIASE